MPLSNNESRHFEGSSDAKRETLLEDVTCLPTERL